MRDTEWVNNIRAPWPLFLRLIFSAIYICNNRVIFEKVKTWFWAILADMSLCEAHSGLCIEKLPQQYICLLAATRWQEELLSKRKIASGLKLLNFWRLFTWNCAGGRCLFTWSNSVWTCLTSSHIFRSHQCYYPVVCIFSPRLPNVPIYFNSSSWRLVESGLLNPFSSDRDDTQYRWY